MNLTSSIVMAQTPRGSEASSPNLSGSRSRLPLILLSLEAPGTHVVLAQHREVRLRDPQYAKRSRSQACCTSMRPAGYGKS